MERKTKTNRAPARSAYDTYLSWWFRYEKSNQMYLRQADIDAGRTKARPLDPTSFERRYNEMRRANITNPARMVAMESREATETQLRKTWEIVKNKIEKATESESMAYKQNLKRLIGKDKITWQDMRKYYKQVFKTFMPYELGDNPFLVDDEGNQILTSHKERDNEFNSPEEELVNQAA